MCTLPQRLFYCCVNYIPLTVSATQVLVRGCDILDLECSLGGALDLQLAAPFGETGAFLWHSLAGGSRSPPEG